MNRITFAITVAVSIMFSGCCNHQFACGGRTLPPRPATINHVVFFKLQNPADADELITDCDRMLATIPGVVSYYAGKHIDTGRLTVNADYDVGLYIGFENEADYSAYVVHPNHVEGVNKWKPRWEWIRVHDVLDDTP